MVVKITDLATILALDPNDVLEIVDTSDTTDDPAGSSFKVLVSQLLNAAPVQSVFGRTGIVVAAADDYIASQVTYSPTGTIIATNVQGAINELDTDVQAHLNDGSGAHTASAISASPTGNIQATNVQGAINEIEAEKPHISTQDELLGQLQFAVVDTLPGTTDPNTIYFVKT